MDETDDNRYTIDHFAPDSTGRPVRGYLINVNQIDTTANGRNFYDVAVLEAREYLSIPVFLIRITGELSRPDRLSM